jgi:hypothetical protein
MTRNNKLNQILNHKLTRVQQMLQLGANPALINGVKRNSLMIAIESHQDDIAVLLVPHSNLTHTRLIVFFWAHARSHT